MSDVFECLLADAWSVQRDITRLRSAMAAHQWPVPTCPIVCVTGTNGKGSTIAFLQAMLLAAGYRVGVFSSPHLFRFEERVLIDGQPVSAERLYALISQVRSTFSGEAYHAFDYIFLAATQVFSQAKLDIVLWEVGVGGRCDPAVLLPHVCLVLTNVSMDHMALLGQTREAIAAEKLALLQPGIPCVYGDRTPLPCVSALANAQGSPVWQLGEDFGYYPTDAAQWLFWSQRKRASYAYPALLGHHQLLNASVAIQTLLCIQSYCFCTEADIRLGLLTAVCPGRFQLQAYDQHGQFIYDVAHNVSSVAVLSENLSRLPFVSLQIAIIAVMQDKAVEEMLAMIYKRFDVFILLESTHQRALPAAAVARVLERLGVSSDQVLFAASVFDVSTQIRRCDRSRDWRCVVFGSFLAVHMIAQDMPASLAAYEDKDSGSSAHLER